MLERPIKPLSTSAVETVNPAPTEPSPFDQFCTAVGVWGDTRIKCSWCQYFALCRKPHVCWGGYCTKRRYHVEGERLRRCGLIAFIADPWPWIDEQRRYVP